MIRYAALCLLALSCGGADRQACYANNEIAAATRVEAECLRDGQHGDERDWTQCEHRQDILAELREKHARCE